MPVGLGDGVGGGEAVAEMAVAVGGGAVVGVVLAAAAGGAETTALTGGGLAAADAGPVDVALAAQPARPMATHTIARIARARRGCVTSVLPCIAAERCSQ